MKQGLIPATLVFSLISYVACFSQPGLVTLEGKQFRLNGQDYYPMVCCYCFNVLYDDPFDIADIYLSADFGYGPGKYIAGVADMPNFEYECDDPAGCLQQLKDDFTKIRQMGFTAIRTCGLHPFLGPDDDLYGYSITATRNTHPLWEPTLEKHCIIIVPPYVCDEQQNPEFYHYCRILDDMLDAARQCGLKVLLDIGAENYTISEERWIEWGEFLKGVAAHLSDDTTLMAYVFFEEALWTDQYTNYTKQEVCTITTYWYDKIHEVDDNHLITLGSCLEEEAWEWDPAVVKVDFTSPHPYPATFARENYSYELAYERFLGRLIWLQRNSPLPWIIGEISLGAMDDYYEKDTVPQPPVWTRYALSPPRVNTPDLQVQKDFAEQSLEDVRNCGASGYSWWQFQETWWVSPLSEWKNHNHDADGLLRHKAFYDLTIQEDEFPLEKPVVEAFENYTPATPDPQAVQQPQNYYNPFNGNNYMVCGYVKDQDEVAIRDAVVYASNWNPPIYDDITVYGFTNENGCYNIGTPYNDDLSHFNYLKASAVGCGVGEITPGYIYLNTKNFEISRPLLYNTQLSSPTTIQINEEETYQAINTIAISNLTVDGNGSNGGSAEIKARNSVTLQSGFWAKSGSHVHVHTGPFLFPCETWPDVLVESKSGPQNIAGYFASEFELHFELKKDEADARIFPNPSGGKYHIELLGCTPENITVAVFDCLGRLIQTGNHTGNDAISIDLKDFPDGSYYTLIKSDTWCISKKVFKF